MFEKEKTLETSRGKLDKTSQHFRKLFLLKLTLEIIRHSKVEEFFVLENIIKQRDKQAKTEDEKLEKKYGKGELILSIMHREPFRRKPEPEVRSIFAQITAPTPYSQQFQAPRQRPRTPVQIPEYPLPPTVNYLRPIPTNIQIDLGKINPLIQDQNVRSIECNGPDEVIIVRGGMGSKPTNIILNREEIDLVFQRFSEASKIPLHEGVFKIVVGRLILSAIISNVVGSKFIIKKMESQMTPQNMGIPMPSPILGSRRF